MHMDSLREVLPYGQSSTFSVGCNTNEQISAKLQGPDDLAGCTFVHIIQEYFGDSHAPITDYCSAVFQYAYYKIFYA